MFEWIARVIRQARRRSGKSPDPSRPGLPPGRAEDRVITSSLEKNRRILRQIFDQDEELVFREILIGEQKPVPALVVFIDSLVKADLLQRSLLREVMRVEQVPSDAIPWLKEKITSPAEIEQENRWVEITERISRGYAALFVEGQVEVLVTKVTVEANRPVSEPINETVTRGPHDAFNEDIYTNLALLRKRLPTSRLGVKKFSVGEVTKVKVYLVYLKGYVMPGLVEEVTRRIDRVKDKIDGITGSGQLEEFIQDHPYSIFSGIDTTERPDKMASALLEGRAGLIADNTPYSLVLPSPLIAQIQSPEDYYNRFWFASLLRMLRWFSLLVAFLLPAFYVSILSYHQELVPTTLLISIINAREGVPFPSFLEALIMEVVFEMLREAGIRLPKPFGQTISIVGAVVIGSAAVSASLVSPAMVVVVALTAIASYTVPSLSLNNNIRVIRFPFMILAGALGLFGIMAGLLFMTFHLCSLRTFGVPFLSPLAPLSLGDLKDSLIRVPNWMMGFRPRLIGYAEPQRQDEGLMPKAPPPRGGPRPEGGRS
ncbi:MAG: spore germination protein [Firmicutes bacterium]|nr:spore germination protein [Bacillota bacterium]